MGQGDSDEKRAFYKIYEKIRRRNSGIIDCVNFLVSIRDKYGLCNAFRVPAYGGTIYYIKCLYKYGNRIRFCDPLEQSMERLPGIYHIQFFDEHNKLLCNSVSWNAFYICVIEKYQNSRKCAGSIQVRNR